MCCAASSEKLRMLDLARLLRGLAGYGAPGKAEPRWEQIMESKVLDRIQKDSDCSIWNT